MRYLQTFNVSPQGSSCAKASGETGTTFIELLVVLVIMSMLAMVSIPYAEKTVQRHNELELRRVLRETRTALDRFHRDWEQKKIPHDGNVASRNGFPVSIDLLVFGVSSTGADAGLRRYLRKLPKNPFANNNTPFDEQWSLLGYSDQSDVTEWNGEDVYDLRANTERIALDGTKISDW